MKIGDKLSLEDHIQLNKEKSVSKWTSKVSINDTQRYLSIIRHYEDSLASRKSNMLGPILSLAVRNGREVDLFRLSLNNRFLASIIKLFEIKRLGFRTLLFSFLESFGRSNLNSIGDNSSLGVELTEKGQRKDIYIGSFDEMPSDWESKFGIVYFNSLDHSHDPYVTAKEIIRIAKPGAYIIIAFPMGQEPSIYDPVADVGVEDIKELFGGELVYFREAGSKWFYTDYIVKIK